MNKQQKNNEAWIIDNYQRDPDYTLYYCSTHGAFAQSKMTANGYCTHCNQPAPIFNDLVRNNQLH